MVDKSTLLFLFNSYCKPNYGLQLWNHRSYFRSCIFKTFEVAYSKVFKRILGVSLFSSSHDAAENCNEFLFKHYIALLQYKYYKWLENLNCSIINLDFAYFKRGYLFNFLYGLFEDRYNVKVTLHDLNILKARVHWIQRHEPRTFPNIIE